MYKIRVSLFGRFRVTCEGQDLPGLEGRKVQELLSYLLIHRSKPHPREFLAELLWGSSAGSQTRKYLRQTLWQLQSALDGQAGGGGGSMLLVDAEWVGVNPQVEPWLDVALLERSFSQIQDISGRNLDSRCQQGLQEAIEVYHGDLLEGCYEEWCLFERERLRMMYIVMLEKLTDCCEACGEYERGLLYCSRVLRMDPARERTHRRLMRLHVLAGDRTAALRQYERCVAVLARELGVGPAKRTVELYERIRGDSPDTQRVPVAEPREDEDSVGDSVTDSLQRLRQVQAALYTLQRQINREIQTIELATRQHR